LFVTPYFLDFQNLQIGFHVRMKIVVRQQQIVGPEEGDKLLEINFEVGSRKINTNLVAVGICGINSSQGGCTIDENFPINKNTDIYVAWIDEKYWLTWKTLEKEKQPGMSSF